MPESCVIFLDLTDGSVFYPWVVAVFTLVKIEKRHLYDINYQALLEKRLE
jgi:hypothetical protein